MKYFVFDMDETLAELYTAYYFVASLRLNEILKEDNLETLQPSFLNKLDKAYNNFVEEILNEEISDTPIGILRPGILGVMKQLNELQKNGKIKNVIIYSNNGHLQSLEFIRDLIHKYLGNNLLIKDCIHWNHHMRNEERMTTPGAANKTWKVLKNIMVHGNCRASNTLEPKDVYFFDDLDHKDLQENLNANYYKVPPYTFRASFDRVALIFTSALMNTGIDLNIFSDKVFQVFGTSYNNSFNAVMNMFKHKTSGTAAINMIPPQPDTAIDMMYDALNKVNQSNQPNQTNGITGGKRNKIRYFNSRRQKRKFSKKRTYRKI